MNLFEFLKEKIPSVINSDGTFKSKEYVEMVSEISLIIQDIIKEKNNRKVTKTNQNKSDLAALQKLLDTFNECILEYKKVESLQQEENEKVIIIKQILEVGSNKISIFIDQVNQILTVSKDVLTSHGRDKEYFNLYRKILSLGDTIQHFHNNYSLCLESAKKYVHIVESYKRFNKLTSLFSESQGLFKEMTDINKLLGEVYNEVLNYKNIKGEAPQETAPDNTEDEKEKQNEMRLAKIMEMKTELERRKMKSIEQNGYLTEFKVLK